MDKKIEVLLFDLGGVLMDYVGVRALHGLIEGRYSQEEVRRLWINSPALTKFESGRCETDIFAEDFTKEWKLDLPPEDFLSLFKTWARAPFDGALELLEKLEKDFTLACLTNTNEAYWRRKRDDMGFGRRFHKSYASHELGLLKPDPRIYDHVARDLACPPEKIAFFDDTEINVAAARASGFNAYLTVGFDVLRQKLSDLGVV